MTALPHDPFPPIASAAGINRDLSALAFPSVVRIQPTELVGPEASNRQHAALEKRTETLRIRLNQVIDFLNAVDTTFLRRDGSAAKDAVAGVIGDMPMHGKRLTSLGAPQHATDAVRLEEINQLLSLLGTFSGTPVGMLSGFAANLPRGWLAADGSTYTATEIISTAGVSAAYDNPDVTWVGLSNLRAYMAASSYPWGGGEDILKVPDCRGRVLIGAGTGLYGGVVGVNVTVRGTYTAVPLVTFSDPPPGGIRATGVAVLSGIGGSVTTARIGRVNITNPGRGYLTPPTVTFTGANTVPAVAEAVISLSPRTLGSYGGEEAHVLSIAELASHRHHIPGRITGGDDHHANGQGPYWKATDVDPTGDDVAHNNMQPFAGSTVGIKF